MQWSQVFIRTLRENTSEGASDAVSLMARAGYARAKSGAITAYLPLGQRSLKRIEAAVRRRLLSAGGQEFSLRTGQLAKGSPRREKATENEKKSRTTEQEARTSLIAASQRIFRDVAACHLRSYKELPQLWFHFGLDSCCLAYFTTNDPGDDNATDPAREKLVEVLRESGVRFASVTAAAATRDERSAEEHLACCPHGESEFVACECGYASRLECAVSAEPTTPHEKRSSQESPRLVETPGQRTITNVSEYLEVAAGSIVKSLLYIASGDPVLALIRGDDQINETLLHNACGTSDVRPATADEVRELLGAGLGSVGPVGQIGVRIIADHALRGLHDLVCGANKDDYHLVGVEPEKDFRAEYFHLRLVREAAPCRLCGGALSIKRGRLLMRSFTFAADSSEKSALHVVGVDNKPHTVTVTFHTLFLDSFLAALIEQLADSDGVVLPDGIAPFDILITPIKYGEEEQRAACDRIHAKLTQEGAEVLLDDRNVAAGVKFKDADLIGIPLRITVGPKKLRLGKVEVRARRTQESLDCSVEEITGSFLKQLLP